MENTGLNSTSKSRISIELAYKYGFDIIIGKKKGPMEPINLKRRLHWDLGIHLSFEVEEKKGYKSRPLL